jgi:hypothetical protein
MKKINFSQVPNTSAIKKRPSCINIHLSIYYFFLELVHLLLGLDERSNYYPQLSHHKGGQELNGLIHNPIQLSLNGYPDWFEQKKEA